MLIPMETYNICDFPEGSDPMQTQFSHRLKLYNTIYVNISVLQIKGCDFIFSCFSTKTLVDGTQKKHLNT